MAALAYTKGDYANALNLLQQSLAVQKDIGDKAGEGATLNHIGEICRAKGDYDTASNFLEQSRKIRRDVGDEAGTIRTLFNLANNALTEGKLKDALDLLFDALHLALEIRNAVDLFNVAGVLGMVLAQHGDHQETAHSLEMAVEVGRLAGFPGTDEFAAILLDMQK